MALDVETPREVFTGNGSTTVFPFSFSFTDSTDVKAYLDDVLQESGYTVNASDVTFDTAPASDVSIALVRETPREQDVPFTDPQKTTLAEVERVSDRGVRMIQEVADQLDRSYVLPPSSSPASRADTSAGYDGDGKPIARSVAQDVSRLGIGDQVAAAAASASAAQVFANTSEEQAGFANDAAVSATASAASISTEFLRENKNILVVGQSNPANGRVGGDMSTDPEVYIWNYCADDPLYISDRSAFETAYLAAKAANDFSTIKDDGYGAWQVWNKAEINPCQASGTKIVDTGNIQDEERNSWPHGFARKLRASTLSRVNVVQSAQSGAGLDNWLTEANGGITGGGTMWNHMVEQIQASGITYFDFFLFDQGESYAGAIDYATAHLAFYNQLKDAGYIDENTIIVAREISETVAATPTAATVNAAIRATFETTHGDRGYVIGHQEQWLDDVYHITGTAHDEVAAIGFDWYNVNHGTGASITRDGVIIPTGGKIIIEGSPNIRVSVDVLSNAIAGYYSSNAVFAAYGADYDVANDVWTDRTGTNNLTPATAISVNAQVGEWVTMTGAQEIQASGALVPATADFYVGMTYKMLNASQFAGIVDQYTGATSGRFFLRQNDDGTIRLFIDGGVALETSGVDGTFSTGDVLAISFWRISDDFYLKVNNQELTANVASVSVEQRAFRVGYNGIYNANWEIRNLVVCNTSTTAEQRALNDQWIRL